ncbi:thiamine pyrophosphate-binding protein [Paenibacillus farraposensis]|uniref:Thiamine pyrophosphate-binding protein n=1 Tax=Paenibacillus farraposensis TaxID=2807095 RepID=A0ABW4DDM2_9BACL|nr:thiamine pyrophosphate-binding protein [Paenibacillus farraposensis]MCC3380884.1 thiamine pyrophosphate-binding protein [Paenibacillus farraposensis]
MTVSLSPWDAIIGYLKSAGVRHLFGLPSDDLQIISSLPPSGMDFILCKDQRNAVFMAAGYALTTNQMSVCVVGKGPALSNTLTGLLEAKNLGAPVLLLALGTGGDKLGTRSFQEADQISLVKPLVKWAYRVEHVERLVWAMERAAFLAINGAPGPVYIELPENLMDQSVPIGFQSAPPERLSCSPSLRELDAAWGIIETARKPLILVGGGMKSATSNVIERFANQHGAALFATASGRSVVDEDHELFCGVAGLYTDISLRRIWEESDVVITLGSRLEETATFEWDLLLQDTPLIQVNVELEDFAHEYRGVKVLGDGYAAVEQWLERRGQEPDGVWLETIRSCKEKAFSQRAVYLEKLKKAPGIHVPELLEMIQTELPENLVLLQENGLQDMWSYFYPYFRFAAGSLSIVPSDQTSLGFGAAAALGASVATECPVVALVGDGAFNLFSPDFITAVQYRIPVIYLVLNNGGYGWLQNQMNYKHLSGQSFPFVSEAAKTGIQIPQYEFVESLVIRSKEEARGQLQLAWEKYQENKLVVIEVYADLADVHEKISHVYGDFPLYDQQASKN